MRRRDFIRDGAALCTVCLGAKQAIAQSLPAQASIIVGFTPGSGPDTVARLLARQLTGRLAPVVIVENRTGASGNIAVNAARAQPANGATLLFNPSSVVTLYPHTYRRLGFSPFDDFTPLSLVSRYELGLAVGPAVPESVRTAMDLSAWVRQQGRPVAYGSPGAGSGMHFVGHVFAASQKLDMTHVAYRGAGPMIADMLGGQVAVGLGSLPALMAQASDGRKLRVLASTGVGRSRYFPSVPTFDEQGIKGLPMREWHGVYIAGKPPAEVIERVVPIVRDAVEHPEFVQAVGRQGFEAMSSSPQELDALARRDSARWSEIVKAAGFVAES